MSFFSASLRAALTARRRGWLLLLLLPLFAFGIRTLLPAQEAAAPVQVGVVLPRQGAEEFWHLLNERSGLVVSFLLSDADEAERQVTAGQWDCALIIPEDFDERLERRDTYQLITLLTGPGSTVYPMVRETVAACVAELISPGVAEDYLLESGIADETSAADMRPRLHETLLEQDRVLVTMETADGRPLDPIVLAESGTDDLLAGLLAIVLLVYVLFAAMDLGRWLNSPFARRLRALQGPLALLLPRLAGSLLPALCGGALGLLALDEPLRCLLPLTAYLLFLGMAALALARCKALLSALPVLMPFVPAAGLLLSPVLLDVSLLFPALKGIVRWMPVTLYLRACDGQWGDALVLCAGAAVILALLWAAERVNAERSTYENSSGRGRIRHP